MYENKKTQFRPLENAQKINDFSKFVRDELFEGELSEDNSNLEEIIESFKDIEVLTFSKKQFPGYHGFIRYREDLNKLFLFLDEELSIEERHFALAHEFAHVIFEYEWTPETGIQNPIPLYVQETSIAGFRPEDVQAGAYYEERRANEFAASLLVPNSRVKKVLKKFENQDEAIDEIANKFGVSKTVASRRIQVLKSLGN